jgi:hypothetical protein
MPLAVTREGEGSGSSKSWARGGMRSTEFLESKTTPPLRCGTKRNWGGISTADAEAMFGMTAPSKGHAQQRSSPSKSARNKLDGSSKRLPSEGCRKRAKLDGISRLASSERSSKQGEERTVKKINRGEEEEEDGTCSSAVSSPLCEPCMPVEVERYPDGTIIRNPIDSEVSSKYRKMQKDYYGKIGMRFESLDLKFLYSSYTIQPAQSIIIAMLHESFFVLHIGVHFLPVLVFV